MFKVVLWDIDGTLLDFEKAEEAGIRGCFAHYNLGECTNEMLEHYKVINRGYWQAMERGEIEKPVLLVKRFEDFLNAYGLDSSVAAGMNSLYQILLGETVVFTPHARETIQALKGKVLQCAVTNGTKVAQDGKLKNSKLDKEFDHIFISEVVGIEKPNVGFFDAVFAEELAVVFDEIVGVGRCAADFADGVEIGGIVVGGWLAVESHGGHRPARHSAGHRS
jgi:2-haloacid dehalogenase